MTRFFYIVRTAYVLHYGKLANEVHMRAITFMLSIMLIASAAFAGDTVVKEIPVPVDKCLPATADHPALNVVINEIPCKAATCQNGKNVDETKGGVSALAQLVSGSGGVQNIGSGVKMMLSNALKETGCFNVVDIEQTAKLKQIAAMTGQEVKLPKIDLFVDGSITAIDVTKSGGALAGGVVPIISLVSKTKESAVMSFDLSVLNPTTAEVIDSKSFSADSSKSSWGFGSATTAGGGAGWSISKSLVLDSVVRDVIFNIANHMAEKFSPDRIQTKIDPSTGEPVKQEQAQEQK